VTKEEEARLDELQEIESSLGKELTDTQEEEYNELVRKYRRHKWSEKYAETLEQTKPH